MLRRAGWLALIVLGGCGNGIDPDAGIRDAGGLDARPDGGAPDATVDAAPADAGPVDAGPVDAGAPIALVLAGDPDEVASATVTPELDAGGRARFSIQVPVGGPYVLYAAARLASDEAVPGASLELRGPTGATIARVAGTGEGRALRLARLLATSGPHELVIGAGAIGGPVELEVRLLAEGDETEGAPRTLTLLGPGTGSVTVGRVNHQEDLDVAVVHVPPSASPRSLQVRIAVPDGGRFDPIVGDRILRVTRAIDPALCGAGCRIDADADAPLVTEATGLCAAGECLLARRVERSGAPRLDDLVAVLPLPPSGSTTALRIAIAGEGSAADAPIEATVVLADDPDEAGRYAAGIEQPTSLPMAVDASGATYPAPPASATTLSGTLVTGHGDVGGAVRAAGDYDAEPSDVDTYVLGLPVDPTLRAWELAWQVEHVAGAAPSELRIDVVLCDGDVPGGSGCAPVATTASGRPLRFVHQVGATAAWFDDETPGTWLPRWERVVTTPSTTTTVAAAQCSCLEDRFARGGHLELRVRLGARASWEPVRYSVRTALAAYPRGYLDATGASRTCPVPCASTAW